LGHITTKDERNNIFIENMIDNAQQLSDELGKPGHYIENLGPNLVPLSVAERR